MVIYLSFNAMPIFVLFLGLLSAYIIGSIPTAYLFARILKGIDIRQFGSGNVGATNTFRVIGKVPGVVVLAIDIFKGFIVTTFIASFFIYLSPVPRPEIYRILMGLLSIAGHNWTIFLKFKGGKGVATSAGVVIGLIPRIFWLGFFVWCVIFSVTGYVSLASIIASIFIPIFTLFFDQPTEIVIFTSFLCIVIAYKHRSNINRLQKGEEKKINLFRKR